MGSSTAESIMTHSFTRTPRDGSRLRRSRGACALVLLAAALASSPARAQTATGTSSPSNSGGGGPNKEDTAAAIGATMALDPTAPQAATLPGGMTPAYGQAALNAQDWRFDFHGLLTAPLNAGFNRRSAQPGQSARPGQSDLVLHAPPVVPDDLETFSHTSVVPTTYAQLNFSEGNGVVSANVSVLARQANVSESFVEPASQLGITDVFLSYLPDLGSHVRMRILVGAFTSRYGST